MVELKTVLRIQKIKSYSAIKKSSNHCYRKNIQKNVIKSRTKNNKVILGSGDLLNDVKNKLKKKGIKKIRKNGVICLEIVLSLTNECFKTKEDLKKFVIQSNQFLKETFCDNVCSIILHLDETTPHLHAHVIPIDEQGKLNAREVTCKNNLKKYQEEYLKKMLVVNKNLKYTKNSTASHETLKKFYGKINEKELEIKNLIETNKIQNEKIKSLETLVTKQNEEISFLKKVITKIKDQFLKFKNKNDKIIPKLEFEETQSKKLKKKKEIKNDIGIEEKLENQIQKDIEEYDLNDFLEKKQSQYMKQNRKNKLNFKM